MMKSRIEEIDRKAVAMLQKEALVDTRSQQDKLLVDFIIKIVAGFYNLPGNYNTVKSRKGELVKGRQVAMYLINRNIRKLSYERIGWSFGNKDHATVLHAKRTVQNLMETERKFSKEVNELQEIIVFKRHSISDNVDLMNDYYYMDFNSFTSIRMGNGKNMMISGFSDDEFLILKNLLKIGMCEIEEARKHSDMGIYVLEKREKEEAKDNEDDN